MKALTGIKVRDEIHWFTSAEKACDFAEVMAENGFIAEFQNHGNCMAVITSHIEPDNPKEILL